MFIILFYFIFLVSIKKIESDLFNVAFALLLNLYSQSSQGNLVIIRTDPIIILIKTFKKLFIFSM